MAQAAKGSLPAPRPPSKAQIKAAAQQALATGVQTLTVEPDEAGMRVDRFLVARFPQLAFTHIQRIVRKGELRIDGKRAKPNERLEAGQKSASRPSSLTRRSPRPAAPARDQDDRDFLKSITLYEDKDVLILNKPMGLAVQGGSGTTAARRRAARGAARRGGPEAAPRPPPRQGHLRLPRRSRRRALPPRRWRNRSARARPGRSTGRWSPACRACAKGASRPIWPRRRAGRGTHACAWPGTATRARATR